MTQSGCLQLVCGHCIFCGYCPLGLGSSALESCVPWLWRFFHSIDNWQLLFAQVNHGVKPEKLREVGTIWESLDLGFAADDTALKLCIEKHPDFRRCVACCTTLHFLENILTILRISGQTLFFYIFRFAENLIKIANGKYRMTWWATQWWKLLHSPTHSFRPLSSLGKLKLSGPHTT